jgi:ketosteroid isomerase-like protein
MSHADIEHLLRGMKHYQRTGEPLWGDMDPEIQVHAHDILDAPTVYRGHDGWRKWEADFASTFESYSFDTDELIDAGAGKVVQVGRLSARGRGSGVPVERLDALVWTIRDGKTVRLDYYNSRDKALDATARWEQAMSRENVAVVRAIYSTWERGELRPLDWAHPEIEYVVADGASPGSSIGLAGMAGTHHDFPGSWGDWRVEAEEYRELDSERVLVLFHFSTRGKASGLDVGQISTRGASLFHLRGGKVTRLVHYLNRERALEAVGLLE